MTIRTIILLTFLFSTTFCSGQKISDLKLDNKQSILNDRVFLQFPGGAENVAKQADIMSADPNANTETRIILDIDKQRLVFYAQELYVTSGKSFPEVIAKDYNEKGKSKILTNKDSVLSILVTPAQYDTTENAILINNLYVRTQDNTVFVIGAYINPDAYKNRADFQVLSEKVFSSLKKGNRRLNYTARTVIYPIFEGKKKFSILLPDGFVITKDRNYDFEVLNFQKIQDMKDTNWVSLIIYAGNYPSYFYTEYDFIENKAEKVRGHFLDKTVEWLNFRNTGKQIYLKEQQIPCNQIEARLIIHIAMLGNNQQAIDEVTKLIENIKLTE